MFLSNVRWSGAAQSFRALLSLVAVVDGSHGAGGTDIGSVIVRKTGMVGEDSDFCSVIRWRRAENGAICGI
ncbi:hypothetical protein D7Z54_31165 [Salibacterium salarium]|uniref:Uncharacterized protein n=1 Tax=Salibacterium salarium TaxID=284579 RepID=A0A3R9PXZ2_9BACI|nr:hypothetical protein [Salibacterium salarium]RSL29459.1 hypothetical protein D7Z54_31165 [Salibacterium salarium]